MERAGWITNTAADILPEVALAFWHLCTLGAWDLCRKWEDIRFEVSFTIIIKFFYTCLCYFCMIVNHHQAFQYEAN